MFAFPEPDPILEAAGDSPAKRVQRANRAGQDTITDRNAIERDGVAQLLKRLGMLKTGLQQRILGGDGALTDFKRFNLQTLLNEIDRLIATATVDLADIAGKSYQRMADTGNSHALDPMKAMQLHIDRATPGLDSDLVTSAFGNTTDLLTLPMQQFATDVKVAVRRVALAGDNRQDEINRLRDKISGASFDSAAFKAERIIRSEMSRVFGQATYDRLTGLSKEFPFLRKGWRAAKDNRTRKGHREAAEKYSRGHGILLADRFKLNVYDERGATKGGKPASATLIGVASLRFPVDPETTPAGRIAAAATIMCRCNSFVDINLDDYARFTKAKVQMALGDVERPAPPPITPAEPKPIPKPKPVKPLKVPKVPTPTAAQVLPKPEPASKAGPIGPKVSAALRVQAGMKSLANALAVLDSVHGDGALPSIPAGKTIGGKAQNLAYYRHISGQSDSLGFKGTIMKAAPNMTTFHEVGHFLDHKGFGIGTSFASESLALATAEQRTAFDTLMKVAKDSAALQTLKTWRKAAVFSSKYAVNGGNGVVPLGVQQKYLDYLLKTKEVFARAYAQYVATSSGSAAALRELRAMQAASTTGPVARETPYNRKNALFAEDPEPGSWDYPTQWSDEDFAPIKAAFDNLIEAMGWRKSK